MRAEFKPYGTRPPGALGTTSVFSAGAGWSNNTHYTR